MAGTWTLRSNLPPGRKSHLAMQHPFPLHTRKGPKRALPSPGLTISKIQPLQRQILLDFIYLHFILMKKLAVYVRYERRKCFQTHVGSNTLLIVNQTNRMKAKASKEATLAGGDAKWGLVCICARWEMPKCSCFHLGNERLLGLAAELDVSADSGVRAAGSCDCIPKPSTAFWDHSPCKCTPWQAGTGFKGQ